MNDGPRSIKGSALSGAVLVPVRLGVDNSYRTPSPAERGRRRWGSRPSSQHSHDRFDDTIEIGEYFVVSEANNTKAAPGEPNRAALVVRLALRMLAAINLDCESRAIASEIDDEGADRRLASEVKATEPVTPKRGLQQSFRDRRGLTQRPSAGCLGWLSRHWWHPFSSLMKGSETPPRPHLRLPRFAVEGAVAK